MPNDFQIHLKDHHQYQLFPLYSDPLIQIKNRELDLRAQENQRRKDYEEARVEIDRTKAVMNQADNDEKLAQNERLAKLRANTSLEKTILQHELKDKE